MEHPRTFSTGYLRVRETLSRGDQVYLGGVEDEIAENPDLRLKGRFERGDDCFATAEGFIIKYRRLEGGTVSFDELHDVRPEP